MTLNRNKILASIGYSAFFSVAFAVMLYFTFPYSIIGERLQAAAAQQNYSVTFGSIGPTLFGVKATAVSILLPPKEGTQERGTLIIPAVTVRPALFPPGLAFSAKLAGGTLTGSTGLSGKRRLVVNAKQFDLGTSDLKALTGLELSGKANLAVDMMLDPETATKHTGRIALTGETLVLEGGKVSMFDLPKVGLGRLESEIQLAEGKANFKTFRFVGGDLDATVEGDIALAEKLPLSTLRLKLKFKPTNDFLEKNAMIKGALNFLSKDASGGYTIAIERALGNPSFRPMK